MRQFADLNGGVAVVEWFSPVVLPSKLKMRREELVKKKRCAWEDAPFTNQDQEELDKIHHTVLERKVQVHQVEILRTASWEAHKGFTLTGAELEAINNLVTAAADHEYTRQTTTYLEHLEDS